MRKSKSWFLGMVLIALASNGCVSRENVSLATSEIHMNYEPTGFRSSQPLGQRLLLRSVKDERSQFNGNSIGGRKAKNTDSAFGRNMLREFQLILFRELRSSGLFEEVVMSDELAAENDYVLETNLQVLFAEVKGFVVGNAGAVNQFQATLKHNGRVVLSNTFTNTGSEGERISKGGMFTTVVDAMDDVASIAIRKNMRSLLEKMKV